MFIATIFGVLIVAMCIHAVTAGHITGRRNICLFAASKAFYAAAFSMPSWHPHSWPLVAIGIAATGFLLAGYLVGVQVKPSKYRSSS